ncbi:MAG TPA: hypothetical protein VN540_09750 [Clostridia bacterium]|nr:hypothetical protein [Clostridia bacterium]
MKKGIIVEKALAVTGTVLALLPLLFTIATSAFGSIAEGKFLFDYLIPMELFPLVLAGGALLVAAAFWARAYRPHIAVGFLIAALCFFGCQLIAQGSGLASGTAARGGFAWYAVLCTVALYAAAEVWLGVFGILLMKKLFQRRENDG